MRKIISVILFFIMAAIFTACGKSADSVQNTEISVSEPVQSEQSQGNSKTDREDSLATEKAVTKNTVEQSEQEEDLAYYTGGRADKEQDDPQARPAISGSISDIAGYDKILLGYPIWHGQAPRIIRTFLESYDFSGKTIVPFCTSHSSGIGSSADSLHSLCTDATKWMDGKRFGSETSKETMEEWLLGIGF